MINFPLCLEAAEASMFVKFNELKKRNITIGDVRTSVTLEPQMWEILHDIAEEHSCSIHDLCSFINDRKAEGTSLASAIRVFIVSYLNIYRKRAM